MIPFPKNGDILVCPICQKQFKYSSEHKFVVNDSYTCSWKCFMAKSERDDNAMKVLKKSNIYNSYHSSYYRTHKEELARKRALKKQKERGER